MFLLKKRRSGQVMLEYSVMLVALLVVVIYASRNLVRPAVNRFLNSTAQIINSSADEMERMVSP